MAFTEGERILHGCIQRMEWNPMTVHPFEECGSERWGAIGLFRPTQEP
jgi:hypothetical protein